LKTRYLEHQGKCSLQRFRSRLTKALKPYITLKSDVVYRKPVSLSISCRKYPGVVDMISFYFQCLKLFEEFTPSGFIAFNSVWLMSN